MPSHEIQRKEPEKQERVGSQRSQGQMASALRRAEDTHRPRRPCLRTSEVEETSSAKKGMDMNQTFLRKWLAVLLAVVMCLGLLPAGAMAATNEEATAVTEVDAAEEPVVTDAEDVNLSATAEDGMTVFITAKSDVIPEGSTVTAKVVRNATPITALIEDEMGDAAAYIQDVVAYDVTIWGPDGIEIEPTGDVGVVFRKTNVSAGNDVKVFHVEEGTAQKPEAVKEMDTTLATSSLQAFTTDAFSVYVVVESVVPRLTVNFVNGGTTIETMYVKADDTAEEVEDIIYDPGAGDVPQGQVFKGWTIVGEDGKYPTNEEGEYQLLSIADVRSAAMSMAAEITADSTVTYTAAIFKQYTVSYMDKSIKGEGEEETLISLGSFIVEIPSYETEASYTVNMSYSTDDSHNLEGWQVDEDSQSKVKGYPEGTTTETIDEEDVTFYPNNTDIIITGDVTFFAVVPEGKWLVFNENGKGATYVAPRFIRGGQKTEAPTVEMKRKGYTFGGWYTDEACTDGNEFTFGSELTEATTIFAKWIAEDTATYSVIIWKQNLAGDGYDFERVISLTGDVDAKVETVTSQGSGTDAYAIVDGTSYTYTGFHLKEFDQNVTIVPEGTAIVNVYYDRNEISLVFYTYGDTAVTEYVETDSTSGTLTLYGLVNGDYVSVKRHTQMSE